MSYEWKRQSKRNAIFRDKQIGPQSSLSMRTACGAYFVYRE